MYRPITEIQEAQQYVEGVQAKDDRQREILANMYYAGCSYIGGLENILSDYYEDDPEYINANTTLKNHNDLVDEIEFMGQNGYYGCGIEGPQQAYQKHYTFAGKAYIRQCAEAVVKAMGY